MQFEPNRYVVLLERRSKLKTVLTVWQDASYLTSIFRQILRSSAELYLFSKSLYTLAGFIPRLPHADIQGRLGTYDLLGYIEL